MLQGVLFLGLLILASVYDLKKRLIPDWINLAVVIVALFNFRTAHLLGLLIALPFLLTAVLCGGMGGGDIKLMAACGLVLGLPNGLLATIIGLLVLLGYYGFYRAVQKRRKCEAAKAFPLAPFLAIGCVLAYCII